MEVKFRWKPELHKSDFVMLERIHRFWNAKVVFINCCEQPYFRVADPPYINKNNHLVTSPLIEETDWKIGKGIYNIYEELVHRYLTPTLVPSRNKN